MFLATVGACRGPSGGDCCDGNTGPPLAMTAVVDGRPLRPSAGLVDALDGLELLLPLSGSSCAVEMALPVLDLSMSSAWEPLVAPEDRVFGGVAFPVDRVGDRGDRMTPSAAAAAVAIVDSVVVLAPLALGYALALGRAGNISGVQLAFFSSERGSCEFTSDSFAEIGTSSSSTVMDGGMTGQARASTAAHDVCAAAYVVLPTRDARSAPSVCREWLYRPFESNEFDACAATVTGIVMYLDDEPDNGRLLGPQQKNRQPVMSQPAAGSLERSISQADPVVVVFLSRASRRSLSRGRPGLTTVEHPHVPRASRGSFALATMPPRTGCSGHT